MTNSLFSLVVSTFDGLFPLRYLYLILASTRNTPGASSKGLNVLSMCSRIHTGTAILIDSSVITREMQWEPLCSAISHFEKALKFLADKYHSIQNNTWIYRHTIVWGQGEV